MLLGMLASTFMRVSFFVGTTYGLPPEEITFAEMLKTKNYQTAVIGENV